MTHTAGRRDGRQKGCESGYYNLHRNLNKTLLHSWFQDSRLVDVAWVAAVASVVTTSGVTTTSVVAVAGRHGASVAIVAGTSSISGLSGISAVRGSVTWGFALGCGNLSLGLVGPRQLHVLLQLLTGEVACRLSQQLDDFHRRTGVFS